MMERGLIKAINLIFQRTCVTIINKNVGTHLINYKNHNYLALK